MKKLLFAFLFILIFVSVFVIPNISHAQSATPTLPSISYEKVNMNSGFSYLTKRVKEKTMLFLLSYSPQKKLNYYEKLLDIRLAELKFIVDNRDIANIEVSSQRYFSTAGQLTLYLVSKPQLSSNNEVVINLFSKHTAVLEVLKNSYENTSAEWRLLRDDVNYLVDYSKQIK